ncbi:MAG TPA: HAD family hydrolase [Chloroflexia bacterium]|nr:HAD family hydrolase [Chloroflexia bacterium]
MQSLIVFDADNTLWDANKVFTDAQLALLTSLQDAGLKIDPAEDLATLRSTDMLLGSILERAEYDFRLLVMAMMLIASTGVSKEEAASQVLSDDPSAADLPPEVIDSSFASYSEALMQIPPLFPGTKDVLAYIGTCSSKRDPLVTAVLSEGNEERLEMILQAHRIRDERYFDEIVIARKSKQAFEEIKAVGIKLLPEPPDQVRTLVMMVGDSLHRDIKLANQADFMTVYKPSRFKGHETPQEEDEKPDYTISALTELPPILHELGVPVPQMAKVPSAHGA